MRPRVVHETSLDFLCELVDILKVEVLGEQLIQQRESLVGLRPTLERILADVHERLTFRARTHIRDEVILILILVFALVSYGYITDCRNIILSFTRLKLSFLCIYMHQLL